jgi:hypothetical protein
LEFALLREIETPFLALQRLYDFTRLSLLSNQQKRQKSMAKAGVALHAQSAGHAHRV